METNKRIIYIAETAFQVDISEQALVYIGQPDLNIPLAGMKDEGEYYSMLLDSNNKTLFKGMLVAGQHHDHVLSVTIPKTVFEEGFWEDNDGIKKLNKLSFERDWNILISDEQLRNRLAGKLPVVDLAGDQFFLDVRMNELRLTDDFNKRISLDEFYSFDERVCAIYDKIEKQVISIDGDTVINTPKNAVYVELPDFFHIDPIGYARKEGFSDTCFLNDVLMEDRPVAALTPIEQTEIPALIQKNRQLQGLPPEGEVKKTERKSKGFRH